MVFFTLVVGPAFFSEEMGQILPRPHAARAIEVLFEYFYQMQMACGVLAMVHLLVERMLGGPGGTRWQALALSFVLAGAVWGGYWLLPSMHNLQAIRYAPDHSAAERREAAERFAFWHAVSQGVNLSGMAVLAWYMWRLTRQEPTRKALGWGRFGG